jgi:hypothetical protein
LLQVAGKKIKQQISITLNEKMRQSPAEESSSEQEVKKRISSGVIVEEDMRPLKCRRLEQETSVQPLHEKLENSSSIMKAPKDSCLTQDVRNVVELKSVFPIVEKLRISSATSRTSDDRTKEETVKLLDSCDQVTSSVCDESSKSQEERQKSFKSYVGDAIPSSTVGTEVTPKVLPSIPVDVTVKFTEDIQPRKSVHSSCVHQVDLPILNEPQRNKLFIHSVPDKFNDTNKNNNVVTTVDPLCGDNQTEASNSDAENCVVWISDALHQSAKEGKLSGKRTSVNEVGGTGPNATFTKASENPQSDGICAGVDETNQSDKANESVPEQQVMLHSRLELRISPSKKMVKPQKTLQMFRYAL